jgi:hypothetical protein
VRLLVLGARQTGLLAPARARGLPRDRGRPRPARARLRLAHRRAILEPDDELALERLRGPVASRACRHGADDRRRARSPARFRLPHPHLARDRRARQPRAAPARRPREAGVRRRAGRSCRGYRAGLPGVVGPLDRKGRRLAEEAAGGAEVTVTAWSSDGVFTPLLGGGGAAEARARGPPRRSGVEHGLTSTRLRLGLDGPRVVELRTDVGDREAELCRLLLGIDVHALALHAALGRPAAAEYVRFGTADAQVA